MPKPSKTTSLRDWNSASYCGNGRAASSLMENGASTVIEGIPINPRSQVDAGNTRGRGGAPGWSEFDKAHSQGGTSGDE
jgi:hypothetical protein